jgi:hypothetical protein
MRITQNYNGKTSHYPHTVGSPKDYPIDEGGKDTGRDGFYCPCDELKIVRLYGAGNGGTNTIWVESTTKTHLADGTRDYSCGLITHPNDTDFKNLYVGRKFQRGDLICKEGTDGATANHLHISFGKGKLKGNGWKKNSRGKYVLDCTGGAFKPEKLFYIDPAFTRIISKGGIVFKEIPNEYVAGAYKVNTAILNVRKGAGTNFAKVTTLVKGKKIKVVEVDGAWGRYAKNKWVSLEYCKKV